MNLEYATLVNSTREKVRELLVLRNLRMAGGPSPLRSGVGDDTVQLINLGQTCLYLHTVGGMLSNLSEATGVPPPTCHRSLDYLGVTTLTFALGDLTVNGSLETAMSVALFVNNYLTSHLAALGGVPADEFLADCLKYTTDLVDHSLGEDRAREATKIRKQVSKG